MTDGELRFSLRRKFDRERKPYLFGSIRMFNVVIFVRADLNDDSLHHAVVRPYTGAGDYGSPWLDTGNKPKL